ncbi:nuclear transport factor 2 family protein [Pseudoduganella sp. LjRoot289]|uniref:nuclear transport factor 2 family protein n=1 Tax=Pseudoduganella sp. LjRoot289 TaxID=3342314 RepID=UPI003ECF2B3A
MNPEITQQISGVEERLRLAMLASDTEELDQLLADDLLFTNHMGQLWSKAADLAMHRSGALKFRAVDSSEMTLRGSSDVPVTSTRILLDGSYEGAAFVADLRFTRVWRRAGNGAWQLAVAHSSAVLAPPAV